MCTVHGVCIHHRCGALGVGVLWLLWLAGFYRTRCHGCCLASVLCSTTLRLPVARRRSTGRGLSFPRRFPGTDGRRFPSRAETVGVGRWGALRFPRRLPGKALGSLHDLCWFSAECRLERCGIPWEVSEIRRANTGNFTPVDLWTQPKPVASAT